MPRPSTTLLKVACGLFIAALVYQAVRLAVSGTLLSKVAIPALPSLPQAAAAEPKQASTNASPVAKNAGTNRVAKAGAITNTPPDVAKASDHSPNTNELESTNLVAANPTINRVSKSQSDPKDTNAAPLVVAGPTNELPTATLLAAGTNTNRVVIASTPEGSTNVLVRTNGSGKTNAVAKNGPSRMPGPAMMGMPGMPGMGPPLPELPPAIQARVQRIVESELLGPIIRPMPMALLGIAGDVAFLRAPSGQTGMAKEGEEVGGLKLVKIGINRVLVEQSGQKQELMIFAGLGGESLLPKTENSHEQSNH